MIASVAEYFQKKAKILNEEWDGVAVEEMTETPAQNGIHIVKEGDTLYKIAKMHEISVSELLLENPYVDVYNLKIGEELCVPVKK